MPQKEREERKNDISGRNREKVYLNGKYYDRLIMDILENEFEGEYIRNKNVK